MCDLITPVRPVMSCVSRGMISQCLRDFVESWYASDCQERSAGPENSLPSDSCWLAGENRIIELLRMLGGNRELSTSPDLALGSEAVAGS